MAKPPTKAPLLPKSVRAAPKVVPTNSKASGIVASKKMVAKSVQHVTKVPKGKRPIPKKGPPWTNGAR